MPFASVAHPALGVSLLKSGLARAGIGCDVIYTNLRLASEIGFHTYNALGELSPPTALLGDWLFTASVEAPRDDIVRRYVGEVLLGEHARYFTPDIVLEALRVRELMPSFLDACITALNWDRYTLVGFTTSFQQNCASLALAKRLKQRHPSLVIVFGGANCEGDMGIALHRAFPFIDFVCSGEGDLAFPELVNRVLAGDEVPDIPGIIRRSRQLATVRPDSLVSPVRDLDLLPVPDFSDYFAQLADANLDVQFEPQVPFETSRGCWWGQVNHCTFCGLNGSTIGFRSKSPQRALSELGELKRYGRQFLVVDNIMDYHYYFTFLPEVSKQHHDVQFHYELKANLRAEHVRALRDAGVTHVQPGIESLSDSILKLMNKGTSALQNIQTMKWCKAAGLDVAWNLLYGFPGEDPTEYEQMAHLLPLLFHLDPPVGCGRVRVDRHSPYFVTPGTFGITELRPKAAYGFVYGFLEHKERFRMAYYFDHVYPYVGEPDEYAGPVLEQVEKWRSARGAVLMASSDESLVEIVDTRSTETPVVHRLAGLDAIVLQACEGVVSTRRLGDAILSLAPTLHANQESIEASTGRLIRAGLLLRVGERLLSLPVWQSESELSAVRFRTRESRTWP